MDQTERRGICADRLLITAAMCLPTISMVDWIVGTVTVLQYDHTCGC